MEILKNFLLSKNLWLSILVIIIVIILNNIIRKIILKKIDEIKKSKENSHLKKKETYLFVIIHAIKYILFVLAILVILEINGFDVTSFLAGLGIVSVIAGLALQDALKDFIMGINIMFDNFFQVGDVVSIDGIEGKVISFGLKTTKIQDTYTDNIFIICNRNIDRTIKIGNFFDIDIPLEYDEDLKKIEEVLETIVSITKENKDIIDIKYLGINEFADSSIKYKLRVWTNPSNKPKIKRYVNHIIKEELVRKKITIPFNQLDVNMKK